MKSVREPLMVFALLILIYIFVSVAYSIDYTKANVVDSSNIQTNIKNLTLSYWGGIYANWGYTGKSGWHDYENIIIRRGESNYTIPFAEINEIKFYWNENPPSAEISLATGETLNGELLRLNDGHDWIFRGDTGYADFELDYRKTSRIIFGVSASSLPENQNSNSGNSQEKSYSQEGNTIHQAGDSNKYYQDIDNITNVENYYDYITNNKFSFAITFSLFGIGIALLSFAIKRKKSSSSEKSK